MKGSASWEQEFERVFREHADYLYRFARRLTRNAEDAEDLLQQLAVNLCSKKANLDKEYLRTWLGRCIYNLFISGLRSPAVHLRLVQDEDRMAEYADPQSAPAEAGIWQEQRSALVRRALDSLNADQLQVLMMHDADGMELPHLSSMIDVPLGTLKSRLHRARAALRDKLVGVDLSDLKEMSAG